MSLLGDEEIRQKAKQIPQWNLDGKNLTRTFVFQDFVKAIEFVNRLVEPAQTSQHHPDVTISYNKVTVSLTTHDAGGLTEKDFELAQVISGL
ncbi:4a-hydroxytetrahydrobiopterin dehydratase [Oscillatoriales cyanobacterium LEGE 11467]|uniref:Putative pterin-4-alpha-carbinolamine dehydratase n=1 Tax=Zarconia navalis LEGE 11467 TaxID=1828826 RepID=A0A928W0C4_9CYAN|nr:4a-hydroxytetrahydrobiopterin dehydratase [Zarconia navalis]MBE9040965.1 4a-hydroxytetrahydrobiopterin dehydratase [Zarconia navalis LEGE 11467]